MKKSWLVVGTAVLVLALVGLIVKVKLLDRQGPAALQVVTVPSAVVFVDGSQVGVTGEMGYTNDKLEPGEHTVRLVPESTEADLTTWEGRVNLVSGIMVVINRSLGADEAESSGETLVLEKINSRDQAFLAIVSNPDQAVVRIDGEPRGFAPLVIEDLPAGNYEVAVSSPGYHERIVAAKTISGYKLVINVQLARELDDIQEATESAEAQAETTPTPTPAVAGPEAEPEKPYVRIKETPTGWLRVRAKPSTVGSELAKVEPGETFPYLEETENGWHKIEYETGEEGWVSGVYGELVAMEED